MQQSRPGDGAHDRYGTAERPPLGGRYGPWGDSAHGWNINWAFTFKQATTEQQQQVKCGIGFDTFATLTCVFIVLVQ